MHFNLDCLKELNLDQRWLWTAAGIVGIEALLLADRARRRHNGAVRPPPEVTYDNQSVKIGLSAAGTEIYASALTGGKVLDGREDDKRNLYDVVVHGMELSNNGDCLGVRQGKSYSWISYKQVLDAADNLGKGLVQLGLEPGNHSFVGIYAQNRPEWVIGQLAAISQSIVIIPLYDTLGSEAVNFIVNQAGIQTIIVDTASKIDKLLKSCKETESLKNIVYMEELAESAAAAEKEAESNEIKLISFSDTIALGQASSSGDGIDLHLPGWDDTCIICYTSGTTGLPKGVMLTHGNLLSNAKSNIFLGDKTGAEMLRPGDRLISYLPLAHMFEQLAQLMAFSYGCKIGFFSGKVTQLLEDCQILKPHLFPVVPRLLNRLSDAIKLRLENAGYVGCKIFDMAYQGKLAELKQGIIRKDSIWDSLVFRKIQMQLGGEVRFCVTGSAPIAPEVLEMCRVALGSVILEGYGQTECTAVATVTMPGDSTGGHVGPPAPCAHITLVDVPELEYWSKNGKGEICIRGPGVTKGYFKNPEKTAEILDSEGWLHTGDIGMWLPNGTLRVIDRKKFIFKLAQGEYVAPEKIESIYTRAVQVEQVFVEGSSLERYLVGIVVPNEGDLRHWFAEQHPGGGQQTIPDFAQLCALPAANAYVLKEMNEIGKQNGLNSIEQVKSLYLCSDPFTIENGLLTPTMKSKRPQLRKHFASVIDNLYKK